MASRRSRSRNRSVAPVVINTATPPPPLLGRRRSVSLGGGPRSRSRSRSGMRRASGRVTLSTDLFRDFMTAVFAPLSDKRHSGTFLFMLILTVGAVFLHQSDSKNSWLSKTGKSLSDTVLLKPIGDFVTNNTDKVVGLVLLVPSVVSLPQSIRFGSGRGNGISSPSPYVVFMIFSLPILWLKAYAIFDYSVYSFGVFLLLHLHSNLHRLFVVLIVFVVWTMSKPVK